MISIIRPYGVFWLFILAWNMVSNANADNLDIELKNNAPALLSKLKSAPYIGILPFDIRFKKDDKSYSNAGMLNWNFPGRLLASLQAENLEQNTNLKFIENTDDALISKKINPFDLNSCDKLFKEQFLMLNKTNVLQKVNADAFLTGTITLLQSGLVETQINLVKKEDPKNLIPVLEFRTKMDNSIAIDAGRSRVSRGITAGSRQTSDFFTLVDLAIESNGKIIKRKPGFNDEAFQLEEELSTGHPVQFKLKNLSSKKLGVVLLVNGLNTTDSSESYLDYTQYTEWILDPKKDDFEIKGFYDPKGENYKEFKVVDEKVALETDGFLVNKELGLIQLLVFEYLKDTVVDKDLVNFRKNQRVSKGVIIPGNTNSGGVQKEQRVGTKNLIHSVSIRYHKLSAIQN